MASDYPVVRLGDYVDACLGKMLDAQKNRGELRPYLGNSNVRWGSFELDELSAMRFEDHEEERYGIRDGDLIVCEGGEPGRCAIWRGNTPMKIQKALHRVRTKAGLDNYFLYYWFLRARTTGELEPFFTGTTIKHLTGKALVELRIPLPPINLQRGAAKALKLLDEKVDLNRRINQTLEAMAQAIFKSWFVDFDPVKAKIAALAAGRDPLRAAMSAISGKTEAELDSLPPEPYQQLAATAALFPEEMEESALGEIPKGWSTPRVGSVLELVYGKALKATDREEGTVPVYGSGGITGYHNRPLVPHGSIIVGRKGTVGSLYWEDEPFFPIDTTYYVRPLAAPLTFCYYAMQTMGLEKMNTDAAVPGLNRENVYRLELVLPDSAALQQFDSQVMTLRKAIRSNQGSNQSLANLRDTLLPKLLTGELSVEGLMAEVEA